MNWTDKFIGIPFKCDGRTRFGCDCWGLVCIVYQEMLGIRLPDHKGVFVEQSISCLKRVAREMANERLLWAKVERPQPFDVILLRSSEFVWHVGIVIDNRKMLHVEKNVDSIVEDYTGPLWRNRIDEFRHYAR